MDVMSKETFCFVSKCLKRGTNASSLKYMFDETELFCFDLTSASSNRPLDNDNSNENAGTTNLSKTITKFTIPTTLMIDETVKKIIKHTQYSVVE
jgi:hypothetical protein